jgi:lipoprotein-releasing system permease protein
MASMVGIAVGVMALIVVLSVMNGFQKELRARILGVASHVQITGFDGRLQNWQTIAAEARKNPEVAAAAPYVNAQALLSNQQNVQGTLLRGIVPELEDQVADIGRHMKRGNLKDLQPGQFGIVLGIELAHALDAHIGEKVVVIAPQGQVTPAGILPRLKQFTVVGIFEVGMFEYDSGLALIHLNDAEKLYRMENTVSACA